jgi:DnaJ like chaperone protein
MIKWVAAFVGFYLFRFPGALLGFFIGGMIDQLNSGTRTTFRTRFSTTQPGSLQLNLLALAATVIKADGVVKHKNYSLSETFLLQIMEKNKPP